MAFDEALAERVRAILGEFGPIDERRMFGGVAFMRKGRMCCGVLKDRLIVKVGQERGEEALRHESHVQPFDFSGRPMAGMLYVDADGLAEDTSLRRWIQEAVAYGEAQPARTSSKRQKNSSSPLR